VSRGIGAYRDSISSTASVSPVFSLGSRDLTLPTLTPEILTSASWASCVASGNWTVIR
jgi:hypothetical protein